MCCGSHQCHKPGPHGTPLVIPHWLIAVLLGDIDSIHTNGFRLGFVLNQPKFTNSVFPSAIAEMEVFDGVKSRVSTALTKTSLPAALTRDCLSDGTRERVDYTGI